MSQFLRSNRLLLILAYLGLAISLPMSLGQSCSPMTTPPPTDTPPDDTPPDDDPPDNDPPDNDPPDNDPPDDDLPDLGVDLTIPNEGQQHVPAGTQVTYDNNPPASGPHWSSSNPAAPAVAQFYDNALHEEQWVHNLEHGHIVVLYDCKGPCSPGLITNLKALIDQVPLSKFGTKKLVITPYSGLPYQLMAIGWTVQRHLDHFDQQELIDFYNRHVDNGPEDIP